MLIAHGVRCRKCLGSAIFYVNGSHKQSCRCRLSSSDWLEMLSQAQGPRTMAQAGTPTAVYVSPQGQFYFPGHFNSKGPAGYQRLELRTVRERDKFERQWNRQLRDKMDYKAARNSAIKDALMAPRRSELRAAMQHMSPFGRDLAREAMAQTSPPAPRDPEARIDINHFDQRCK